MKPSTTDKILAAALFALTVLHTASHFHIPEQIAAFLQAAPCSTDNQALGKELRVFGEVVQIELSQSPRPNSDTQALTGEVHIALNTDINCRIDAIVANQEWQSWSHAQQQLITIGASVEIQGQIGSNDGQVVLEVNQPPNLH